MVCPHPDDQTMVPPETQNSQRCDCAPPRSQPKPQIDTGSQYASTVSGCSRSFINKPTPVVMIRATRVTSPHIVRLRPALVMHIVPRRAVSDASAKSESRELVPQAR